MELGSQTPAQGFLGRWLAEMQLSHAARALLEDRSVAAAVMRKVENQ